MKQTFKPEIQTNIKVKCDGYTLHVPEEYLDEIATYLHFRRDEEFTVAEVRKDLPHINLIDRDFCGMILHLGWNVYKYGSFPTDWWVQV